MMVPKSAVTTISLRGLGAHRLSPLVYRIGIGTKKRGGKLKTQRKQGPLLLRLPLYMPNCTLISSRRRSKSKRNDAVNVNALLQSRKGHCPCLPNPFLLVLLGRYAISSRVVRFLRCSFPLQLPRPQASVLALLLHEVTTLPHSLLL